LVVLTAGWLLNLSATSWAIVLLATGLVWTAEAFNTAVEFFVDLVHPEWHPNAGRVKDLAAAAVLLAAITALVVGVLIFGQRLLDLGYLPFLG
jgi:diacylglycerol kinase (ATP)